MILLDTNIVSESGRHQPDADVVSWLARTEPTSLFVCTPVIAELSYGAERFLRRTGSDRFVRSLDQVLREFRDRVLVYQTVAAILAGKLIARREGLGRPLDTADAMIAAIALVHGATLATRNVRDFDGLDLRLVNPFEAAA